MYHNVTYYNYHTLGWESTTLEHDHRWSDSLCHSMPMPYAVNVISFFHCFLLKLDGSPSCFLVCLCGKSIARAVYLPWLQVPPGECQGESTHGPSLQQLDRIKWLGNAAEQLLGWGPEKSSFRFAECIGKPLVTLVFRDLQGNSPLAVKFCESRQWSLPFQHWLLFATCRLFSLLTN